MSDEIILRIWSDESDEEKVFALPFITPEDIAAADKLVKSEDKIVHAVSAYFKRKYVGNWFYSDGKKPLAKNKYFNVSHTTGAVAFAECDNRPIGVDIEKIRRIDDGVKRYATSTSEYAASASDEDFLKVWTAKESLVKSQGAGIVSSVKDIPSMPLDGKKTYLGEKYYSHSLVFKDYVISVTLKGDKPFSVKVVKEQP